MADDRSGQIIRDDSQAMHREAICIDDVTVRLGSKEVLSHASFKASPGSIVGLVGRNGSGKSTLMYAIAGLLGSSVAGTGTVRGYSLCGKRHCPCGLMVESPSFSEAKSAEFNLRLMATVAHADARDIERTLRATGLDTYGKLPVRAYSLGMRKRLAFAQAIIGSPPVILLDEPMNGLDPEGVVMMREEMRRLARSGSIVVMSSHLLHEVEILCDTIYMIQNGACVELCVESEVSGSLEEEYLHRLKSE